MARTSVPIIGDMVWYYERDGVGQLKGPWTAFVTAIYDDETVDLAVVPLHSQVMSVAWKIPRATTPTSGTYMLRPSR